MTKHSFEGAAKDFFAGGLLNKPLARSRVKPDFRKATISEN